MQLPVDQLARQCAEPLQPLYVLVGDEPLSLRESLDTIRAAARKQGYDERCSYTAERNFDWRELLAASREGSLFSSRRLLELFLPTGRPGMEGSRVLQDYAAKLPVDTVTIVALPALDRDARSSAWYGALERVGVVVPLETVDISHLPHWISCRLALQGQQAHPDTLQFIADQVEGNLLAAHQEIQKLGLLFAPGRLEAQAVREAVLNVSRYDPFQLGDAMLAGDAVRTARILSGLKEEGVEPPALLGVLAWLLRGVARLKLAEARGENLAFVMHEAKIWGERQVLARRMLARVSLHQLQAAMLKMAEIDKMAKGVILGQPWLEIARLCQSLARTRTHRQATS